MIASNSYHLDHALLRRGLSTASALIRPKVTEKQRRTVDSCCAIEVTTDRLSYAALCLDPENKNSVILSSWNSLSLSLPSGREFRPSVCSSMFKSITQRLVHDICSSEKLTNSQFALVYVSSKLSSASLVRAGFMGYLIGYLCAECIKQEILSPDLPIFTMNHSYRKHILSSWKSTFIRHNPESVTRSIEDLFIALPKLVFTNNINNFVANYLNIFNTNGGLSNPSKYVFPGDQNITYNQLSLANVLVDGYGFLVHGIMNNSFAPARNCSNIIKDNILSNNNLGKYTDIILRPIIPSNSFSIIHKLDNHNIHQALITGYLLAFLSYHIDNTSTNRFNISTDCPTNETLTKWINQSTSHWATLLNHQMFNNPTNIVFSFLPIQSKRYLIKQNVSTTLNNNNNNNSLEMIYLQITSSQLFSIYKCTNLIKQKDIATVQFLLARCLFTCMYYLLQDKYSMLTKSVINSYL
ncbi:hypothetical protein KSF78_0002691 [Schistosoma japonicum]|nr:hypothetical protein KSF78_0002691 [Schistosoma japonicum]KAH8863458.1 hypothetical protein KSF78_0002691 [Schistosoma japonicum]KAH8863459.1 hypothetical protein KSF78_0002691 [Schistosoma japonicum]